MEKVKLSKLPENARLSVEESSTVYTVAELKREIIELGEPHHELSNWYTVKDATWTPDAESVLERLIEDSYDEMYEGWDDRAGDCFTKENTEKLQELLNEMFDSVRAHYTYDQAVEIDIFPEKVNA